MKRKSIG